MIRTQCSLLGRGMDVREAWQGLNENLMDAERT